MIRRGFEGYGQQQSSGAVRENEDALGAISALTRQAAENTQHLRRALVQSGKPDAEQVASSANALLKTLEQVWTATARRRDRIREYGGRR